MVSESEFDTCTECYHAKALLSQAVLVDSSIVSFNCGHGVTEIVDDSGLPPSTLKALSMNTITDKLMMSKNEIAEEIQLGCLMCNEEFPLVKDGEKSPLLSHLLLEHQIVIADVDKIADFNRYINYWKEKFSKMKDITDYCVVVNPKAKSEDSESDDNETEEKFFLLTDFLPEDAELRQQLNLDKLRKVLDEQQAERYDNQFTRSCLFCQVSLTGNRSDLFKHMSVQHAFNVGNADNIVHAAEFIDTMQDKLDNLVCLFCENQFEDNSKLKDHMKKKGHTGIDPKNTQYDRFYVINYLDPGKNWKELQDEPEYEKEDSYAEEEDIYNPKVWEDWNETETVISLCLFCSKKDDDVNNIITHMKSIHEFDMQLLREELDLDFYDQVKIINYIRMQVYHNTCPCCLDDLKTEDNLNEHFFTERHYGLPRDRGEWDQSTFFFPTFEDDSLLCSLEDTDVEESECVVSTFQ